MWYAQDKLQERRERNELYRQAVERRLSSGGPTKKKPPVAPLKREKTPTELLDERRKKETGYVGGIA